MSLSDQLLGFLPAPPPWECRAVWACKCSLPTGRSFSLLDTTARCSSSVKPLLRGARRRLGWLQVFRPGRGVIEEGPGAGRGTAQQGGLGRLAMARARKLPLRSQFSQLVLPVVGGLAQIAKCVAVVETRL